MNINNFLCFLEAILDNEEFCNFVEYMMNSSKTTQDPILPLCKLFNYLLNDQLIYFLNVKVAQLTSKIFLNLLNILKHITTYKVQSSFFVDYIKRKFSLVQLLIFSTIQIRRVKILLYPIQIVPFKLFNLIKQQR